MAKTGASLAKSAPQNRREWPRYEAERSFALAASVNGEVVPCTVADVSLGGAKLIFDSTAPEAETIELSHPDAEPVNCVQVWRSERAVGIEFDFSEDSLGLISVCLRHMIDLERQPEVSA